MRSKRNVRRGLAAIGASLALVIGTAVGASAWTNYGDIACTSSTGWQIHIKSYTKGDLRHELVTPGGALNYWRYPSSSSYVTRVNKTGNTHATQVSVLADYFSSASRYCGTA